MADWRISQGNLGDLAGVAPGDTVTLEGHITGLSWRPPSSVTISGDNAVLDGEWVERYAIHGQSDGVVIEGLTVENYRCNQQHGAIAAGGPGRDWVVRDCTIRHVGVPADGSNGSGGGYGIRIGHGMLVERVLIEDAASLGIGGVGDDVVIRDLEVRLCNFRRDYSHFGRSLYQSTNDVEAWLLAGAPNARAGEALTVNDVWEGGGSKFAGTNRLRVERAYIHHNGGRGLWFDIDNRDSVIEDITADWNLADGIVAELGYGGTGRYLTARNNSPQYDVWLWGAGILLQNVAGWSVENALVETQRPSNTAFGQIHQNRTMNGELRPARDNVFRHIRVVGGGHWGHVSDAAGSSPPDFERIEGGVIESHDPKPLPMSLLPGTIVGARALPTAPSPVDTPPTGGTMIVGANLPWLTSFAPATESGVSTEWGAISERLSELPPGGMLRAWVNTGKPRQRELDSPVLIGGVTRLAQLLDDVGWQLCATLYQEPGAYVNGDENRVGALVAGVPGVLWDVVNEPEWPKHGVSISDAVAMVDRMVDAIHAAGGRVTVNHATSDYAKSSAWDHTDLDVRMFSWYDIHGPGPLILRASDIRRGNEPVYVGEAYLHTGTQGTAQSKLTALEANGYAGVLGWSLFPNRTADGMSIDYAGVQAWAGGATPPPDGGTGMWSIIGVEQPATMAPGTELVARVTYAADSAGASVETQPIIWSRAAGAAENDWQQVGLAREASSGFLRFTLAPNERRVVTLTFPTGQVAAGSLLGWNDHAANHWYNGPQTLVQAGAPAPTPTPTPTPTPGGDAESWRDAGKAAIDALYALAGGKPLGAYSNAELIAELTRRLGV